MTAFGDMDPFQVCCLGEKWRLSAGRSRGRARQKHWEAMEEEQQRLLSAKNCSEEEAKELRALLRTYLVRPLFFISLFLVTRARSFRQQLKKKKKDRPLELSGEVRSEPNMIVHANNNIVSRSRGVSARPRTIVRLCNNSQTGSDCRQLLTRRHRRCR